VRIIGLTGGIGSGKSFVSGLLKELGAEVIDADEAARAALDREGPAYHDAVAAFGEGILDGGGHIDRARLADTVFSNDAARARLNAIVHPRVREEMARALEEARDKGAEVVVMDVPLLFENSLEAGVSEVMVVWTPENIQVERAVARGMREDDVRARIRAQLPIDEKRSRADIVIDNSGDRESTRRQVVEAWRRLADLPAEEPGGKED
jgi:dephospho-CoA kinase